MHVGIDVSATRGYDVAAIDAERRLALLARARDLDALAVIARGLPPEAVVAIDAPPGPSKGLVPGGKRFRVAEEEIHRLGVSLYPVPPSEDDAQPWMREGFATFELFAKTGFPLFLEGPARRSVSIEVYPHLSYLALAGTRRGAASKIEWSRSALRGTVRGLPKDATQDQLDAACAALTAWYFGQDRWVSYGDPREGVIVAPRTGPDLGDTGREADQLALAIDAAGPTPAPAARSAPAPARETPFSDRVLRMVGLIPPGRVATYGDVARWCGNPSAGRAVGTLVGRHAFEVPCHRVVDAGGRPSPAYPGGPEAQARRLEAEGVPFAGARVDLAACRWRGPA